MLEAAEQRLQRFVLLLAAGITLLLVLAEGTVLKASQTGKQPIDQIVLEPVILVGDKGDEVQIPVGIAPARDLKDFRPDHALGVVLDSCGLKRDGLKKLAQLTVKASNQIQIRHAFLDFRRLG